MDCDRALPLVPLYLDGELSETQADELRPHLLACAPCRTAIHAERALKAWFVPVTEIAVPEGFAARVARRAFAGDRARDGAAPAPAARSAAPFAVHWVAAAALILIALAIAMRRLELPAAELQADTERWSLEDSIEALRTLNTLEGQATESADGGGGREKQ